MKALLRFWDERPRLAMWAVLAVGMVIIMVVAARNVGFTAMQWFWLVLATIGLAGLCAWIIGWEDDDESEE